MRKLLPILTVVAAIVALLPLSAGAAGEDGKVYTVATAHLDTQWRWTIRTTIDEYLRNTLHDNFALLEKYPDYVFNFEGAFRYQLMKEYYPAEYKKLEEYVKQGRWRVCGSWLDAVDVNMPAPESLIRHALYGNGWFERELGVRSVDVFLPDCFGFGYALPAVMKHCGLTGFSSQKLTWGSAYGVPFDVGVWRGVGGARVLAALNPGAYDSDLTTDVSRDSTIEAAIARTAAHGGPKVAMRYYGTGDVGGAPKESSVEMLEKSIASDGPVHVVSAGADDLFRDVTTAQADSLPLYDGELVMTSHGAGCYTSEAAMKRWNRRNETLASAAEAAASLAWWLGGKEYPREELERAWTRFLWHQFHDDLTGTSIPEAYTFSWNDELLSQQEFSQVLADAVGAISRALDTDVKGTPVIVFNPLGFAREDLVTVPGRGLAFDGEGKRVASQTAAGADGRGETTFLARVPACGAAVFDLVPDPNATAVPSAWIHDPKTGTWENNVVSLRLTTDGLVSLYDKTSGRELLAAPPVLQLLRDEPSKWPAWEVDYDDLKADPYATVPLGGVPDSVERGPALLRFHFRHEAAGSRFDETLTVSTQGDATWDLDIDWRTPGTLLKAAFFPTARDTQATYDLGLGLIRRGLDRPQLYEVPAQRWAAVTDASGDFGFAVTNDSRYGWDRPDIGTLRLSLIHTPAINDDWQWVADQRSMDLGRHRVRIGMAGFGPRWSDGIPRRADRLNQPLLAFVGCGKHPGAHGRSASLLNAPPRGAGVAIRAVKLAEDGRGLVVRLQETAGRTERDVALTAIAPIRGVRELRGDEVEIATGGDVRIDRDGLRCDLEPFGTRTFALDLEPAAAGHRLTPPSSTPLDLPWNLDGIGPDDGPVDGDFDGAGHCLPDARIPQEFVRDGITFRTGPRGPGQPNLVACRGQTIPVPEGKKVQVLACAITPDGQGWIGDVPDGRGWFGQWDSRVVGAEIVHDPDQITPAFVRDADLGWLVTHRRAADGKIESYTYTTFYRFEGAPFTVADGKLTLPDDPHLIVLAATATDDLDGGVSPAEPLLDRPTRPSLTIRAGLRSFCDHLDVAIETPNPHATVRFTLDGSAPTDASPVYQGPIRITESAVLTATVAADGFAETTTRRAAFTKVAPRPVPADAPHGDLPHGLTVRCYEGAWDELPDFDALKPVAELSGEPVGIPARLRDEDVGAAFDGWLMVPRDGMYRLYLASDDGSRLWLDGELALDLDGLHGASEYAYDAPLAAGLHRVRLDWFQHLGGRELTLMWSGPGIAKQAIPVDAFRHEP